MVEVKRLQSSCYGVLPHPDGSACVYEQYFVHSVIENCGCKFKQKPPFSQIIQGKFFSLIFLCYECEFWTAIVCDIEKNSLTLHKEYKKV